MTTVTKKIDDLPAMTDTVANNDELVMLDVSASAVDMTKLITMSQIPISLAAQLASDVVENAKIKDGAVTNSKLGADAVNGTKIADDSIDSEHYVDGSIDLAHMSANSIDSDQYVDGSIDRVHLAADIVDGTKIADNAIGNEHIRDSTAWSVIGRSANTSGDPADISTTTDGYVLRTSGTTLGFGTVSSAGLASSAVTAGKIATGGVSASGQVAANILALDRLVQVTGPAVIGKATTGAGNLAAISGTDGQVLRVSGTTVGFGTISAAGIATMTSADLAGRVSDETGTGKLVFGTSPTLSSPTLVTPALGTPASGTLTNCTGLPSTSITGTIATAQLANDAVTEDKLGAIKRTVSIPVFGFEDTVIVKNFSKIFSWPPMLNGHIVTAVYAVLLGAVSSSGALTVKINNGLNEMASITINQSAWSGTATPNTSYDDVASFGQVSVNVTGAGSNAKGMTVYLEVTG